MKILLTSDWYTPAVNGVVTSVKNLRAGLQARGHEVRILTLSQSARSASAGGVNYVSSIGFGKLYPGARLRTVPCRRIQRELLDWAPDIVHSNCEFNTFHPAYSIARTLQIPLIHTYHTIYEDYTHYFCPSQKLGVQIVRRFSRWVAGQTDCMIAPTEKTADLLRSYGITTPIRVVSTGIDLSRFSSPRDEAALRDLRRGLGIPEDCTVLAAIGRLAKEKNTEELLQFLTAFRNAPLRMLVVGGGPYQQVLEEEVDRLGLRQKVIFTGMVAPERVADYYKLGDLFVCASTSETQGLTYQEALASGLPLLCRADPCLQSVVIEGENGWQYHTETQFRQYLTEFLAHPERWAQYRARALSTAQKFSREYFAQQMEEIYLEQVSRCRVAAGCGRAYSVR